MGATGSAGQATARASARFNDHWGMAQEIPGPLSFRDDEFPGACLPAQRGVGQSGQTATGRLAIVDASGSLPGNLSTT